MIIVPSATQFGEVAAAIERRLGLHFPPSRWPDLSRALDAAASEMRLKDSNAVVERIIGGELSHENVEVLASHLTIGETYFFRERGVFQGLETTVFPELIRRHATTDRRLRIWCAACSTGEEPYSVAILLEKLLPDIHDWNVSILATDINPNFLKRAREGVYKEWSFRNTSADFKTQFFTRGPTANSYELLPRIRRRVTFGLLNLADDLYPAIVNGTNALDVILCRNVLIYFSQDRIREVAGRLFAALAPEGCLIVSPTETSQQIYHQFQAESLDGCVLYWKSPPAERAAAPAWWTTAGTPTMNLFGLSEAPRPPRAAMQLPLPAVALAPSFPASLERAVPLGTGDQHAGREAEPEPEAAPNGSRDLPPDSASTVAAAMAKQGRIAANCGKLGEALKYCDDSLAADKLEPATHQLRAVILDELGRTTEAIAALKTALYLAPTDVLAHFTLAQLFLKQAHAVDARRHFSNVLALLKPRAPEELLQGGEGLTAGRLAEITRALNSLA